MGIYERFSRRERITRRRWPLINLNVRIIRHFAAASLAQRKTMSLHKKVSSLAVGKREYSARSMINTLANEATASFSSFVRLYLPKPSRGGEKCKLAKEVGSSPCDSSSVKRQSERFLDAFRQVPATAFPEMTARVIRYGQVDDDTGGGNLLASHRTTLTTRGGENATRKGKENAAFLRAG